MLNSNSIAAAVGVGVNNVQFKTDAQNLPRKILLIGTVHASKEAAVTEETPVQIFSPEDAGDRFGFGSMLHRLAVQAFIGAGGVPIWALPQFETDAAATADGNISFTASSVEAGTLVLLIAGIQVSVSITDGMTAAQVVTAIVAAVTAMPELPATAAVNGSLSSKVDFEAKSAGPWGNSISIAVSSYPTGLSGVITAMSGGTGVPDIGDALDALGVSDDANENFFTDVTHGYGADTDTLNAVATYVGYGNAFAGLYSKTIARPFRCLVGGPSSLAVSLSSITAMTADRKTDRANGIIVVPGSESHPSEIAAQAIGHMARIANERVAQNYIGIQLIGIHPGPASRWTNSYDNRDAAVKAGISPTRVQAGLVYMQDVVTFYRPDSVPVSSNGYRSMRNIAIIQNMLNAIRANFLQEKWQGVMIVSDTTRVTSMTDRQKARDVDAVKDDLLALAKSFESKAWIYNADFTIGKLREVNAVVVRTGGSGFDNTLSVLLSGEGGIIDTLVEFDTSLAILTA